MPTEQTNNVSYPTLMNAESSVLEVRPAIVRRPRENPLESIPGRAGPVALRYNPSITIAHRNGPLLITLPEHRNRSTMQFYPLKGGEQYLARYFEDCQRRSHLMFLGFDESAFVTGVTLEAWKAFEDRGEEGFFEALMPSKLLQIRHRIPGSELERVQGDIWSLKLPLDPQELVMRLTGSSKSRRRARKQILHGIPCEYGSVLGTNHKLSGRMFKDVSFRCDNGMEATVTLAEGMLTAADHKPKQLQGLHAIARSENIAPVTDEQRVLGWE